MTTAAIFGSGFEGLSEHERLRRVAAELEAVVLTQMLKGMRDTVPNGGLFEKSAADDIFRSMLDSELARVTAKRSPFGLADALTKRFENRIKEAEAVAEGASMHGAPGLPGTRRLRGVG